MEKDWRLGAQMDYLHRVALRPAVFRRSETNDHMHCEFCWNKFAEYDDCLHEGYCTLDGYYWVCEDCFRDFREMFAWVLVETESPVPKTECLAAGSCVLVYSPPRSDEKSDEHCECNLKHISEEPMAKKPLDEKLQLLFEGILTLRSVEECEDFFGDLCTKTELREMSKRLYAAKLISEGAKYADIVEITGLSTATITRVNGCLRDGNDGYVTVLGRLSEEK